MARISTAYRKCASWEIKARARSLAYLNDANKVMVALANEFGVDRPVPSRVYIQEAIDKRRAGLSRVRADTIGCEL